MITRHSSNSQIAYGIEHYLLDTFDDLKDLNKKSSLKPGSTVFIIETSKYYMLNGKRAWIEINPYGVNITSNGGSGNGGSGSNDFVYDGGSIDDSDPN